MQIDCVFSGGGVKAFAFLGALEAMQEKDIDIIRSAGTSAGAIMAALVAANYTVEEMSELMEELDLTNLLDPPPLSRFPFMKWVLFYFQKGLYKGDKMEKWLYTVLAAKGLRTFGDLKDDSLKVIVSDISLGKLVVLPDDLLRVYGIKPELFPVATAVRMSAGFPYFFMPKTLDKKDDTRSYMVDGGLLSNFPLWIFRKSDQDKRPVLGITLSDNIEDARPYPIKNALDMMQAVFHTMQRAHDSRFIAKSKEDNIIFLPVKDVKTTEMGIGESEKSVLKSMGKEKATAFLRHWP